MGLTAAHFGTTPAGVAIDLYTLTNGQGVEARVMTYGGTLVALQAPDQAGRPADITLGFDTLAPYLAGHFYFGALIGRYGNRIAAGRFRLDGAPHILATNDGPHHLHGGRRGFDQAVWAARPAADGATPRLVLTYRSPHGEEGYPGTLDVTVVYTLTADNALQLDYTATTDAPTVLNLTNHTYFNLGSAPTIRDHVLQLRASRFLPVDATLIPTGELRPVAGTPFDFRSPTPIGARLGAADPQLAHAGGYDHTWVIDGPAAGLAPAAQVRDPASGRTLEVLTTQPGVQFYSGNFLDGSVQGKGGRVYVRNAGFCLETQHFPDSPNQPAFPSTVLRPGATYRHTTVYRVGVAP